MKPVKPVYLITAAVALVAIAATITLKRQSEFAQGSELVEPVKLKAQAVADTVVKAGKSIEHPAGVQRPLSRALATRQQVDFEERLHTVNQLGTTIDPADRKALIEFLQDTVRPAGLKGSEWVALKNDIMNVLREEAVFQAGLTGELMGLIQDQQQHVVMRDYAMQHLSMWEERLREREEHNTIRKIRAFQFESMAETRNSVGGVSMRALYLAHRRWNGLNEAQLNRLKQTALEIAGDAHAAAENRMVALQVCGDLGMAEVIPTASQWAFESRSIPLRLAAIGCFRNLGTQEAKENLEQLSNHELPQLSTAARAALEQLKTQS